MSVIKQDLKNPRAQFGIFFSKDLINLNYLNIAIKFLYDRATFKPEYFHRFHNGTTGIEIYFENPLQVFEFGRLYSMIENQMTDSINKDNSNLVE